MLRRRLLVVIVLLVVATIILPIRSRNAEASSSSVGSSDHWVAGTYLIHDSFGSTSTWHLERNHTMGPPVPSGTWSAARHIITIHTDDGPTGLCSTFGQPPDCHETSIVVGPITAAGIASEASPGTETLFIGSKMGLSFGVWGTRIGGLEPMLNSEVSGPFSDTSTFDFSTPRCSFAHQVFDATYTTRNGTGSFSMDGCSGAPIVTGTTLSDSFSGTFALTAPDSATLQGNVAGSINGTSGSTTGSLSFTLTPTGGTKEFANSTGVVNLTGTWQSTAVPGLPGPITGSLSGGLN